jgi:hypothetical protein
VKLAFYHGPRAGIWKLLTWLLRWRTRGRFDHVEMIFSDGVTASASLSHGGIKFIDGKEHPYEHWLIVEVDQDETWARRWFEERRGAKFDIWGVVGFIVGFTRGDDDRWFCSEACAAALEICEPWRFDPNTLYAVMAGKGRSAR